MSSLFLRIETSILKIKFLIKKKKKEERKLDLSYILKNHFEILNFEIIKNYFLIFLIKF